jgi:hypothetical protein
VGKIIMPPNLHLLKTKRCNFGRKIIMPPKLHLLVLLGKQVDVILAGNIKNGGNVFWCLKSEELMAGKYSKTLGTCFELAGTCFMIGKTKFQSKFQQKNVCIIYNNGSEFKLHFCSLCDTYGIKRQPTSVKNPQAKTILERIHVVHIQI